MEGLPPDVLRVAILGARRRVAVGVRRLEEEGVGQAHLGNLSGEHEILHAHRVARARRRLQQLLQLGPLPVMLLAHLGLMQHLLLGEARDGRVGEEPPARTHDARGLALRSGELRAACEAVRNGGVASHREATTGAAHGGALRPALLGIRGLRNRPAAEMAGEATAVSEVATLRPSRAGERQLALRGAHVLSCGVGP